MESYNNAFTEVYTILEDLNKEEYNKIPSEIIVALDENRNKQYLFKLNNELELKDHTLLPETKAILFNLFRDYLATPEQKEKIIRMQNEERRKNELSKQQNYAIDVFSNRKNDVVDTKDEVQHMEIVEYKENIFKKIFNKVKKFLGFMK